MLYKVFRLLIETSRDGDVTECGVRRGGSIMVMAAVLLTGGRTNHRIFLYDTF